MSDVAASGGYYIACNANKIVAQPSTITGSIGVVGGKPVVKGFYDWIGVSNEYVLRGTNAGIFRESEKFTDSERAKFQEFLKSTYDDFTDKVAKGRSKDQAYIDSIGQGRVWTGRQGKETDWSMSMAASIRRLRSRSNSPTFRQTKACIGLFDRYRQTCSINCSAIRVKPTRGRQTRCSSRQPY